MLRLRDDVDLFAIFIEDLLEQLSYLDACLLNVERNTEDMEAINMLFRVFHSLKGLFYTMEYQELGDFFHRLEDEVQKRKNNNMPLKQNLIDLTIDLREYVGNCVFSLQNNLNLEIDLKKYIEKMEFIELDEPEKIVESIEAEKSIPPRQLLYESLKRTEIVYLQMIDSERKIIDPKTLILPFESCLQIAVKLADEHLKRLFQCAYNFLNYYVQMDTQLDHLAEGLIMETFDWAMKLMDVTKKLTPEDERKLMVHIDMMQAQRIIYLQQLSEDTFQSAETESRKLGEILVRQGKLNVGDIEAVIKRQKDSGTVLKLGEALVSENMVKVKDVANALEFQNQIRKETDLYTFIRIPEHKVDILVEGMEELMIMQTQLKEKLKKRWLGDDLGAKLQLDRIDKMLILLQHQAISFRLQSLETTLKKVELIGRSAAKDLGKEIEFQFEGLQVEVNRSIIEHLQNPIMHLIRNAIYHGIELPDIRETLGKSRQGLLQVQGEIDKNYLNITISDDGRGLDLMSILNKAISLGIAESNRNYAEWEIIDFIFESSFTTLDQVDNISGRGLGMNIVEMEIKALGGHIEIQNRTNMGVAFVLKIPLHMENFQGTLVSIGDEKIIIPSDYIVEIYQGNAVEWMVMGEACKKVTVGNEALELIPIGMLLEQTIELDELMRSMVVVIEYKGIKKGLPVSKTYREMGVVVSSLDEINNNVGIFNGVAVINEREFALILDVKKLLDTN